MEGSSSHVDAARSTLSIGRFVRTGAPKRWRHLTLFILRTIFQSRRPVACMRRPLMSTPKIFLLSPAYAGGKRAELILRDGASFPLARRIRAPGGAPLGDVYSFLSGLYFRGKMAYVRAFARPLPDGLPGAFVITPTRGLMPTDAPLDLTLLREFADGEIAADNPGYRGPLE